MDEPPKPVGDVYLGSSGIDEITGVLRAQTEDLVPKDVRRKLRQPVFKLLSALVVYLLVSSLLGWRHGLGLIGWWLGGLMGFFLLDTDSLLEIYFLHPEREASQEVRAAVKKKHWPKVWEVLLATADKRKNLILHSVLFEAVLAVLAVYVVTSSSGLFAKSLILSFWGRILYEQVKEFFQTGKIDRWFWQIREPVPNNLQAVFLTVGLVIWLVLNLGAM